MFAENLLESGVMHRDGRRGWATLASLSVQLSAVAVLALLPSLYPEIMAMGRAKPQSVPIFSQAPQVQQESASANSGSSGIHSIPVINVSDSTLRYGQKRQVEIGPAGPPDVNIISDPSFPNVIIGRIPPPILKESPPAKPLIVSHMDEGQLLRRVQPPYPPIALKAGIQGPVTLAAIISKTGEIESLRVISGHPMLAAAARDAVSQWRYRPYVLNGVAIEVETQITVNFKLQN